MPVCVGRLYGRLLGPLTPFAYARTTTASRFLGQDLLDVAEVLEISRRRQLFAKSSKCEFGPQGLGFLGHDRLKLSWEGVSVDLVKVQSRAIVEWATPTTCMEASRAWRVWRLNLHPWPSGSWGVTARLLRRQRR